MMMPKFIAAYDGLHFVAGVGLKQLQNYVRDDEDLKTYSESFLGLSRAFVSLSASDLFKLGGFAVVLQPKQVIGTNRDVNYKHHCPLGFSTA